MLTPRAARGHGLACRYTIGCGTSATSRVSFRGSGIGLRCLVYHADAVAASCRVFTYRDGVLSALGHDLELDVGRFAIDADEERRTVDARFDASSLRVVGAQRDGAPLPDALGPDERSQIERAITREVLTAGIYPEIRFSATDVRAVGDAFEASGRLVLHGVERPLVVRAEWRGDRYVAATTIHQPAFGITPYRAFLGALRVKPDVDVRIVMPAPPAG